MKLIAFYLPQFHPIAENDVWWGEGFTEWTNVSKAKPRFKKHYQPHKPSDLGYYDLRVPEVRSAQAELAAAHGIHGFCYYHYWFEGRRLLNEPLDAMLDSQTPDFPFCLCWANEHWTRRWDGKDQEILMRQTYSQEDDVRHIQWLLNVFKDKRYIRVNGKPLLLIYQARALPDPLRTAELWRSQAKKEGIGDIYLCGVESFPTEHGDPSVIGFDAAVGFQPEWGRLDKPIRPFWGSRAYQENRIFDYKNIVEKMILKKSPAYRRFPCVFPSWDNSARREKNAAIFINSTPELYEKWLRYTMENYFREEDEKIIFINAWNEWGEGNHLEPCQMWQRGYLEATQKALRSVSR